MKVSHDTGCCSLTDTQCHLGGDFKWNQTTHLITVDVVKSTILTQGSRPTLLTCSKPPHVTELLILIILQINCNNHHNQDTVAVLTDQKLPSPHRMRFLEELRVVRVGNCRLAYNQELMKAKR